MVILDVAAAVIQRHSLQNASDIETLAMRRRSGSLQGYWEFPGGKREIGESMSQCLIRELHEELSVSVVVDAQLGVHVHETEDRIINLHGFLVTRWQGDIELNDHDKMLWLKADHLDQLLWCPADLPFVHQIKNNSLAL